MKLRKFSILYKDDPEVIEYALTHTGDLYGNGASLVKVRRLIIQDAFATNEGDQNVIKTGLAFCCEGTLWSYLYHKIHIELIHKWCSVFRGWF